jgi:hypothetical protein
VKHFKIALVLLNDTNDFITFSIKHLPFISLSNYFSIQHIILSTWQHLKKTQQIEKIYIQRQQLLKVYVTFHRYSYIYSSPSRLKFYLVVVLTYKGNNECQNLFSN